MRYICSSLLLVLFVGMSCKKDKSTAPSSYLTGSWKWVMTSGGFAGTSETPASSGKSLKYTFKADSTVTVVTNGAATNARYHIYSENSAGHKTDIIAIGTMMPCSFTHANDTLWLSEYGISDAFTYTLVKE